MTQSRVYIVSHINTSSHRIRSYRNGMIPWNTCSSNILIHGITDGIFFSFFSLDGNCLILFSFARLLSFFATLFVHVVCWLPFLSFSPSFSLCSLVFYSSTLFSILFWLKLGMSFKISLFWLSSVSIVFLLNSWFSFRHECSLAFNFSLVLSSLSRNHCFLTDWFFYFCLSCG